MKEGTNHGYGWRILAKECAPDLIPYWFEHVRDEEYGAFHLNLSRQWQPMPPRDKVPAMIGRQVFAFSAACLLSGEDKYIEVAREGADYLLEHAWDREYGGWFDGLTRMGAPKGTVRSVNAQLYSNVGLALYYFTTGDERVRSRVEESVRIRRTAARDEEFGGYYQALNRDLSVHDDGKNKHAPYRVDGAEVASIGAQLTGVLSLLRLYHQTGNATYPEHGKMLGDKISRYGWDAQRGGWYDLVEKAPLIVRWRLRTYRGGFRSTAVSCSFICIILRRRNSIWSASMSVVTSWITNTAACSEASRRTVRSLETAEKLETGRPRTTKSSTDCSTISISICM